MEKRFDNIDELLKAAAREENSAVDFDALLQNVKEAKAAERSAARGRMRLLSVAAALVIVVAGGAAMWNELQPKDSATPRESAFYAAGANEESTALETTNSDEAEPPMLAMGAPVEPYLEFIGESLNTTIIPGSLPNDTQNALIGDSAVEYVLPEGSFTVSDMDGNGWPQAGWAEIYDYGDGTSYILYAADADNIVSVYSETLSVDRLKELLKDW